MLTISYANSVRKQSKVLWHNPNKWFERSGEERPVINLFASLTECNAHLVFTPDEVMEWMLALRSVALSLVLHKRRATASLVPQHTLNEACVNEAISLHAADVIPNEFSRAPARALLLHAMWFACKHCSADLLIKLINVFECAIYT